MKMAEREVGTPPPLCVAHPGLFRGISLHAKSSVGLIWSANVLRRRAKIGRSGFIVV